MSAAQVPAAAQSTSTAEGFHPSYCSQDAMLVIASRDRVKFCVHPIMLQMASEIFSNMLAQATDMGEPLVLHKQSHTVKLLLDFIYPNLPYFNLKKEGFYLIWNLLIAAEKYVIAKIPNEFCNQIPNDKYFTDNPIQVYAIATRFNWKEVACSCALGVIDQLYDKEQYSSCVSLSQIDAKNILRLHKFADMYRDAHMGVVAEIIENNYDTSMIDDNNNNDYNISCMKAKYMIESCTWRSLLYCPSGKRLVNDFQNKHMKEYLFDGWEDAYWRSLSFGGFPRKIDEIELDSGDDGLID